MTYRIAAIPMTVIDLYGHSSIAVLSNGIFFSYSCAAVDKISTASRGPSATSELLVEIKNKSTGRKYPYFLLHQYLAPPLK